MIRRLLFRFSGAGLVAALAILWITRPQHVADGAFAGITADAAIGQSVFWAAGCASCHKPVGAEGDGELILSGGQAFPSPFGTFYAPNITPDALSDWTLEEFATALRFGTSPNGSHYYPAFPYASYSRMTDVQIADLWAYMQTLPSEARSNTAHELKVPANIRAGLGVWKFLYLDAAWVVQDAASPELARGRMLVEALGHCGECHTPRTLLGGVKRDQWLAGAPSPAGTGQIPPLTPDRLNWSAADIAYYLESGFTPDYDSAGGHMVDVISNFAKLSAEDRQAVAAYLKALPLPAE